MRRYPVFKFAPSLDLQRRIARERVRERVPTSRKAWANQIGKPGFWCKSSRNYRHKCDLQRKRDRETSVRKTLALRSNFNQRKTLSARWGERLPEYQARK